MKTHHRLFIPSIALALLALPLTAAETHVVEQKKKEFCVAEITVKPGDTVTFKNSDDVTHNVFSSSKTNPFVVKAQQPNDTTAIEFKEVGVTEVRCAFHPKMKLTIRVQK